MTNWDKLNKELDSALDSMSKEDWVNWKNKNNKMNYTNPNDPDYQDEPEDWLNSALIFARALSLILNEKEGIVVDIKGDVQFQMDPEVKRVIVFKEDRMIRIIECHADLEEGQYVKLEAES
jgi:hypothetical protein